MNSTKDPFSQFCESEPNESPPINPVLNPELSLSESEKLPKLEITYKNNELLNTAADSENYTETPSQEETTLESQIKDSERITNLQKRLEEKERKKQEILARIRDERKRFGSVPNFLYAKINQLNEQGAQIKKEIQELIKALSQNGWIIDKTQTSGFQVALDQGRKARIIRIIDIFGQSPFPVGQAFPANLDQSHNIPEKFRKAIIEKFIWGNNGEAVELYSDIPETNEPIW